MLQFFILTVVALLAGCTTTSTTLAGSPQGASSAMNQSVRVAPAHEAGDGLIFNILAAEISALQGNHEAAFDYYARAASLSQHPLIAQRGAKLSIHSQNVPQTIEATRRWVELEPDSLEARRILGALYLRDKQVEQAVEQFNRLLGDHGDALSPGFRIVAEQLRKEPDGALAEKVLRALVNRYQQKPEGWYTLGWYYSRKQQFEEALKAVDKALEIEPGWSKAVVLRGTVLESLERTGEQLRFLRQQVEKSPDDVDVRVRYGQALLKQMRTHDAVLEFEQALELAPRSAQILNALSLLYINEQQYDRARPLLQVLLELPGQQDRANFYLGEVEKGEKNLPEAISRYASVGKGGLYLNARIEMATLMAEEDVDAGLSILRGLAMHDPHKKVQVMMIEASLLEQAKRFAEAIRIYDQALKLSPGSEDVLYSRAMASDLNGDLAALERDLHTIVKKNPGHYHAWNALGYTLTLKTRRYDEAKGYLEKALALRPKDFYVLDSMGWVLYKLKDLEKSIDFLQRALEVREDAEVAAHLGEVHWVNGDYDEAKRVWRLGRQFDGDNQVLLETLRRFNQ